MSHYFPKPLESYGKNIKVMIDLLIMRQKLILKIFRILILQVLY